MVLTLMSTVHCSGKGMREKQSHYLHAASSLRGAVQPVRLTEVNPRSSNALSAVCAPHSARYPKRPRGSASPPTGNTTTLQTGPAAPETELTVQRAMRVFFAGRRTAASTRHLCRMARRFLVACGGTQP